MKKKTLKEFVSSEKANLHVLMPAELVELIQNEADDKQGGNKSRIVISIIADYFNLLAHS